MFFVGPQQRELALKQARSSSITSTVPGWRRSGSCSRRRSARSAVSCWRRGRSARLGSRGPETSTGPAAEEGEEDEAQRATWPEPLSGKRQHPASVPYPDPVQPPSRVHFCPSESLPLSLSISLPPSHLYLGGTLKGVAPLLPASGRHRVDASEHQKCLLRDSGYRSVHF